MWLSIANICLLYYQICRAKTSQLANGRKEVASLEFFRTCENTTPKTLVGGTRQG